MDRPANGEKDSEVLYLFTLQMNGLACIECGIDFRANPVARVQVGKSNTGAKVFACEAHQEKGDDVATE